VRYPTSLSLRTILCGLIICLFAASASAQFRASVQGSVADPTGAVVPGATVTLTSNETNKTQQTTTSDEGFYRFTGLAPGRYSISAEQSGFKKQVLENIAVSAEETQGINLTLETGAVAETVTVSDTVGSQLQTENGSVDRALTTTEIRQLPQVGRDPYELARLTPGVFGDGARGGNGNAANLPNTPGVGGSNSSIFQTENQVQISANGQRVSNNNYQIDGVSVNSLQFGGAAVITPNQESVKEIRILSSSYSAEDGRNSGAQVKVVSQNGTNDYHGSAFLKYNSPKLNSFNKYGGPGGNPTLPNQAPQRDNNYQRQFGGSFGGPLFIPHFGEGGPGFTSGKNKLFFFASYEGLRFNANNLSTQYVETPQYRQLVASVRPNGIAARVLSLPGIAPRIASLLPVDCSNFGPNLCRVVAGGLDIGSPTGATGQYVSRGNPTGGGFDGIPDIQLAQIFLPGSTRGNQYNARFDYNRGSKDTFTLSTYIQKLNNIGSDSDSQGRPLDDVQFKPNNTAVTLLYNRILSSTMLNEARFNVTRFADNQVNDSSNTNFGIPRLEFEGLPIPGRIRFGAPRARTTPGIFAQNTFDVSDTLSKVIGNNAFKFGALFRKEQNNNNLGGQSRPDYTFFGPFNFANDTPFFYTLDADPVTGGPTNAQRYLRSNDYAAFVQDDWKVRPNLTINLGLRYEYFSPLTEKRGQLSNLVFGSNGLANSRVVLVDQLYKPDRNNFGPRLGFAYSPKYFGEKVANNLVLRGGFGIAYNRIPTVLFANAAANPPGFASYGICCGTALRSVTGSPDDFSTPFAGGQILYALGASNSPFSYPANPALAQGIDPASGAPNAASVEIFGAQPKEPNSYVYTYSFEGQYGLPYKLTATLGYQGSVGHKLIRLVNQNFLFPNSPKFFQVFFPTPDVNSSYNALNAVLTRRFGRGFQMQANYRFSKSIDQLSYEGPGGNTNQTFPQDNRTERGPSDFDVKHNFNLSSLYELPFFNKRTDFLGAALGGFSISGILTAHTGFPFTPKTGQNQTSTPGGPTLSPVRPIGYRGGAPSNGASNSNFISGIFPGGGTRYFVLAPPGATVGRPGIGRNSFRGPGYFNVDLSLVKQTRLPFLHLGEQANFEFRANLFNAFNILNLAPFSFFDGGTFIENPNFGRASGGLSGRVVELQGRFRF